MLNSWRRVNKVVFFPQYTLTRRITLSACNNERSETRESEFPPHRVPCPLILPFSNPFSRELGQFGCGLMLGWQQQRMHSPLQCVFSPITITAPLASLLSLFPSLHHPFCPHRHPVYRDTDPRLSQHSPAASTAALSPVYLRACCCPCEATRFCM